MSISLSDFLYSSPFMLPLFIGGLFLRFGSRKNPKAWKITVASLIALPIVWIIAVFASKHGSELPGAIAYFYTGLPVGSLICEVGLFLQKAWGINEK